jgi:hypothetical protein
MQVRIYTKPRGLVPDYNAPVILHEEARSVADFCDRIHKGDETNRAAVGHASWSLTTTLVPRAVDSTLPFISLDAGILKQFKYA